MSNRSHPDLPRPRRWAIDDADAAEGTVTLAGWDYGGAGPIALLSHANGFCGATWRLVAELLREHFHVIAVDARGHGDSPALRAPHELRWQHYVTDLAGIARELLAETGEPRIAFGIGSSFGGIVTAASEAANPGLFERIAMLDPPLHPTPGLLDRLDLALPAEPTVRRDELVAQTRRRTVVWPSRAAARDAWRNKPMFAAWRDAAFEEYLRHGFRDREDGQVELKCHPDVEAHIFDTTGSLDFLEFAPKVQVPVMLAHAARGFFAAGLFKPLAGLFPKGVYVELDGGHLLPMEAPEITAAALLNFAGHAEAGASQAPRASSHE